MQIVKAEFMKVMAIVSALCLLLSSHLFAVLRPRYPIKASPPFQGEVIVIGGDTYRNAAKHFPGTP